MIKLYATLFCSLLFSLLASTSAIGQARDTALPPPLPTLPQYNAGFDVIIKNNGEIVHGLVKEVSPLYVYYKRTDIPDGPIYSLPRNEVYAISYRNQVTDYLQPVDADNAHHPAYKDPRKYYPNIDWDDRNMFSNGVAFIGVGALRSFSKVKNAGNYSSSASFPIVSLGYEVYFKDNLRLGALIGFGQHNFSKEEYSDYDSTINNLSLKENIFGLYVYGKYTFLSSTSRLQPYVTAGLGLATSHVKSENRISFTDDSKVILVKSGARSAGINIMARVGAEYYFSKQARAFLEVGSGLALINLGVAVSVN